MTATCARLTLREGAHPRGSPYPSFDFAAEKRDENGVAGQPGVAGARATPIRRVVNRMALVRDRNPAALRPRVLCVDDDRNVGATVQAILGDEGYDVSCLFDITNESIRRGIDELEPDCILLDSASRTSYSLSWEAAAWIRHRTRPIPVVMFTAHLVDSREALADLTERAREAGFAAVLPKPFSIDQLLAAVSIAVGRACPVDPAEPLVIAGQRPG